MGGKGQLVLVVLTLGNPGTPMGRSLIYWPHQRHLWLILERPSGFSFHLAFFSHAMEMNSPEILICESALKVKIEQSYGIWNWHKVRLNKFQMKNANLSTFSFYARSFFWTTPTPSLVDPWTTLWPYVSHTMEMKGCLCAWDSYLRKCFESKDRAELRHMKSAQSVP